MSDKATLLIVDDESVNLAVMSKILADQYTVRAANSGLRCLDIVNSQPRPDLILLDIQMPDMNGYEVLKQLKQNADISDIPVIFVTASDMEEDEQKGLEMGAVDFILKPIRPAILLARIKTQLLAKKAKDFLNENNNLLQCKVTENEQYFEHVIDSVPAAIYEATFPEFELTFLCSKIQQYTGLDYQQFNKGKLNWYEQIHPEDKNRIKKQINSVAENQEDCFQLEYRFFHADKKTIVWLEDNGSIEYDMDGKPKRIFGAILDIDDRKEAELKLLESSEATIKTVSRALEKRDPYTAGHQYNCARISKAIAEQLKLDDNVIKGIFQAAAIHDIGKIYLPSEILNKPTNLSYAEFGLVKTHPQVGYDIIKDVDFPWPIAKIILQHHERNDGSGYPNGLKASEICIEAKILAVADVMDAMSSNRPYRKGLGIEAALAELELNVGKFYDEAIVKACIILFRDKGFSLQDA